MGQNRVDVTIGVAAFTLTVATAAVALRLWTRKTIVNRLGIDDACAAIALTFYVSIVMYNASLMAIKMTFLSQYFRIFHHASRKIVKIFIGFTVFVGLWSLSQLVVAIFMCDPISGYWDKSKQARCIPNHPFWEINAAGNILTDIMIFILPIPILKTLNLPRRQRHILIGIFGLGFFTVCISLVRIRFLRQYEDFTWENVESSGWSMGELASGLTCACLPTLRPLIARYAPWMSTQSTPAGSSFRRGSTSGKDTERGILGRASSSRGGSSVRVHNHPPPVSAANWPLPMVDTPGVTNPVVQRMDSGPDATRIDGVVMSGPSSARSSVERIRQGASARPSLEKKRSQPGLLQPPQAQHQQRHQPRRRQVARRCRGRISRACVKTRG
ncbi:unnamed protein product [Parascedosporium putredinis]|uniref:Rhodopsin domain-containing protein n=1 Tax=Parascedosporium putredinis TaxID=1442378 RepID=A0A9P1H262_9PEZI|nr:unnamed protein product [Parascedosporium putredinis]CAI7993347.1 unnamed protein product [Parascedosporium putredinis]